ncbi:MAG TPA: Xaa-Pro peptidase family protein [bacterium]|nr:Xaa-Pro peptidase family protein [bacterium]
MALFNRDRANDVMDAERLDALIATSKENSEYASGYHSHGQWAMPSAHTLTVVPRGASAPTTLVVSYGELDVVAEYGTTADRVQPYGNFYMVQGRQMGDLEREIVRLRELRSYPDVVEATVVVLRELGLADGRLGLDESGLLPHLRQRLRLALPGATFSDGCAALQKVRMVKTTEEIERLARATEIAEHALLACVASFTEGADEHALLRVYEGDVLAQGGRPSIAHILIGEHGAFTNGHASNRKLRKGDTVRFDVGCAYRSYNADIARIACFGDPDERTRRYYDAILAGEEAALALVKPGVRASQLFDRAVEATRAGGIPGYDRNHVGHGIGIELYDPPLLSRGVDTSIERGMVLNVETPYYELGWIGLQVEDTVVVTDAGCRFLTRSDRGLLGA